MEEFPPEIVAAAEAQGLTPKEYVIQAAWTRLKKETDPAQGGNGESAKEAYYREEDRRPHLYSEFKDLAQAMRDKHMHHTFSASMLVGGMRWDCLERTGEPLELRDCLAAFWARRLLQEDPSFVEWFEWRDSVADDEFPRAAELIAKHRGKKPGNGGGAPPAGGSPPGDGGGTPPGGGPSPQRTYNGQDFYEKHIKPFTDRFGEKWAA